MNAKLNPSPVDFYEAHAVSMRYGNLSVTWGIHAVKISMRICFNMEWRAFGPQGDSPF